MEIAENITNFIQASCFHPAASKNLLMQKYLTVQNASFPMRDKSQMVVRDFFFSNSNYANDHFNKFDLAL